MGCIVFQQTFVGNYRQKEMKVAWKYTRTLRDRKLLQVVIHYLVPEEGNVKQKQEG